jgi:hypothetical protein
MDHMFNGGAKPLSRMIPHYGLAFLNRTVSLRKLTHERISDMKFIIPAVLGCLIFAVCFAVFLFKGRKGDQPARLHTCGQGNTCQCRKQGLPPHQF